MTRRLSNLFRTEYLENVLVSETKRFVWVSKTECVCHALVLKTVCLISWLNVLWTSSIGRKKTNRWDIQQRKICKGVISHLTAEYQLPSKEDIHKVNQLGTTEIRSIQANNENVNTQLTTQLLVCIPCTNCINSSPYQEYAKKTALLIKLVSFEIYNYNALSMNIPVIKWCIEVTTKL